MEKPPRTPEGVASLIGRLTGEMGFSPLSDKEIRKLTERFCPKPDKAPEARKKTKPTNEPAPEI